MGTDREGVSLTHLDEPLFDGAGATKRDLVDYLDAVSGLILPELRGRPLSVIRVRAGQQPFMQKNLPDYAPPWVGSVTLWAESSRREVRYALCDDRRTLLWLANQRAVEYHPTLSLAGDLGRPTHLVLDIDPPPGGPFGHAVAAAHLIRRALDDLGLAGAVKTSGSKGLHIYVPVQASGEEAAAATPIGRKRRFISRPAITAAQMSSSLTRMPPSNTDSSRSRWNSSSDLAELIRALMSISAVRSRASE